MITDAASPARVSVAILTPEPAWRAASRSTTGVALPAAPTDRMVSDAAVAAATATARSTALAAVADPSVPTRIRLYTAGNASPLENGGTSPQWRGEGAGFGPFPPPIGQPGRRGSPDQPVGPP